MSKKEGITIKKENFSEWYVQTILKSELADYTAVSGCIVFRPYSYEIWEKIKDVVDKRLKKMNVKNAYFPLLIPESLFKKEATHIKGFAPEVAWVDYGGNTKLGERLAIRPTSETLMYDSYSKWVRSWRDLPLKLNQWNNVLRFEFKHAVPFLRTREFLWNEGHTVFATKKEAEKEMKNIINMWQDVCENYLALPGLIGQKSEKEKFAGAEYTWTIEYYLPNGKAIQGPDAHHDGQIFAKAFNIKFLDKNEKEQYAYQNTWAITTRMLGVMFAIHGDDKGLILPPKLAPNKAVIIPIYKKKDKVKVLKKSKEIFKKLKKYDCILDDREEYSPGWKYNYWELKGIPIRIELGPRDLKNKKVILVRRDTNKKESISFGKLSKKVDEVLEDIHKNLFNKAEKLLKSGIIKVKTWNEFLKGIKNKKIVFAPWCGEVECEDWIKDKSGGAKSLNIPFNQRIPKEKCIQCKKQAKYWAYFGKSY